MTFKTALLTLCLAAPLALGPAALNAATIGTQTPAPPLTQALIDAEAPAAERAAWTAYLRRPEALMAADKASLAAEREGLATIPAPARPGNPNSMPLNRDGAWYGGAEAKAIAANILSFQTPAGGWSKNQNRADPPRVRGQSYLEGGEGDSWSYIGTFDNDATQTELAFLARVQAQYPGPEGEVYRAAFLKGVRYILTAQYPNGAFPQVYPLMGGYHDALTFNDNGFAHQATFLREIAARKGDYAFVPADLAAEAGRAADKAMAVLLKSQVVVDGKKTVWGQQHDPITLQPVGARNYEMRSLAAAESAGLLIFLMQQDNPTKEMQEAVHAGIAWLKDHAITGYEWTTRDPAVGRMLYAKEGAGPLWSRFYSIETGKPIFGERDQRVFDDVADVGSGRRNGYSWYNSTPRSAIEMYDKTWKAKHPQ
jgi:PelA/Pel-15E family pectate lyase